MNSQEQCPYLAGGSSKCPFFQKEAEKCPMIKTFKEKCPYYEKALKDTKCPAKECPQLKNHLEDKQDN